MAHHSYAAFDRTRTVAINPLISGQKGDHYVTVKLPDGRTVGDD